MKTMMRTMACVFCATILSTTTALAQDAEKTLEERAAQTVVQFDAKLNLTEEQEAEIYKITLKYFEKAQQLKNSSSSRSESRSEKMSAMKADRSAKESEMEAVLSSEQFAEWKEMSEEMTKQMRGKRKNR